MKNPDSDPNPVPHHYKRVVTPTLIQMETMECGAVCLGIILGYYGKFVSIEQLRIACAVSRDGSNAYYTIQAAKSYGLEGEGYTLDLEDLFEIPLPAIIFWNFEHFVVLEGFDQQRVYINDPATGPRTISYEDLDQAFTGVVLVFKPTPSFQKSPPPPTAIQLIANRLKDVKEPLFYALLTGAFLVVPNLAFPAFTQIFIDKILINHILSWKAALIIGMLLTITVSGVLSFLQGNILNRLSAKLAMNFSSSTFWHMLKLPISFYHQRYPGEIAYRLLLNDSVAQTLVEKLTATLISLLFALIYGLAIFYYDALIAVCALVSILLNFLLIRVVYRARRDTYARLQAETGKSNAYSIGALKNIETIKSSGNEGKFFKIWVGYYTKMVNSLQEIAKMDIYLTTAAPLMSAFTTLSVLGIGGWKVITGELTIGMLLAIQILLYNFIRPVTRLIDFTQSLQLLKVDISRLDDIMDHPIDASLQKDPHKESEEHLSSIAAVPRFKLEGYVDMHQVNFSYSPVGDTILSDITLRLKPGKSVALVGVSGCGKSTLVRVLAGLYKPTSGNILFDGNQSGNIPRDQMIHSLSLVEQEPFLFQGTAMDNLTLLDPTVVQEELIRATKDACIHDEILSRLGGYNLEILENGANLSGGQRQRFEIARGLVNNPSILILDEATSALDSETEAQVIKNIRRRGCALLIIAHRLSTIKNCDEIIVLDKGRIVNTGTHAELKEVPGVYQELLKNELAWV